MKFTLNMKNILFLVPLLALAGCLSVPMTKISGTVEGKPFELDCPKNVTLNGFKVSAETNRVTVEIQSLTTVMDPQVITTTGDAQTKLVTGIISATGDAVGKAAAAAGKP